MNILGFRRISRLNYRYNRYLIHSDRENLKISENDFDTHYVLFVGLSRDSMLLLVILNQVLKSFKAIAQSRLSLQFLVIREDSQYRHSMTIHLRYALEIGESV